MGIDRDDLENVVSKLLDDFYERRIRTLKTLKLDKTLRKKNPYMFRAIGLQDASEIIDQLLSAYMSSSDEGIFGDAFFEPLAKELSGGVSAPSEGVDIAIETDEMYKAIAIKSGPSVYNRDSKKKQNENFMSLRSRMLKLQKHYEALVGYCYGRKVSEPNDKKIFRELAGQAFWADITGDEGVYVAIIQVMRNKPLEHKEQYMAEWAKAKNLFTREFIDKYCTEAGAVDWEKIVKFNSGRKPARKKKS